MNQVRKFYMLHFVCGHKRQTSSEFAVDEYMTKTYWRDAMCYDCKEIKLILDLHPIDESGIMPRP